MDVRRAVETSVVIGPVTPAATLLRKAGIALSALSRERHIHQLDARSLGHLLDAYVSVELPKDDALNPRPGRERKAVVARAGCHIEGAPLRVLVGPGGLEDGICFGMDRANAVSILHQTADLGTMRLPGEAPIVPRQDDALVADNDCPHGLSRAGS